MLLKPKSRKYAKAHKGRISPIFNSSQSLVFGTYGIIALQPSRFTALQISAVKLAINRSLKKDGEFFFRTFPHIPASQKPAEVRMGKGKGSIEFWYSRIRPGAIILEFNCSNVNLAKLVYRTISSKLPFKSMFISSLS